MTVEEFLVALRIEFEEELKPAAYTKQGIQLAFERSVVRAILKISRTE